MSRTPYTVAPYGEDKYKLSLGTFPALMREGFIFVYQDVRGRWMSEGTFDDIRPQTLKKGPKDIDESTDTYDTIDWLVKNIANNNGKAGQYGTSYPGFYTAVGTLANHPALVASSPQAPISDFFFDDFHHNGAFVIGYFKTFPVFGVQKDKPTQEHWFGKDMIKKTSDDGLVFYNELGTLKEGVDTYYKDNFFMQEIMEHPNYDVFWQKRNRNITSIFIIRFLMTMIGIQIFVIFVFKFIGQKFKKIVVEFDDLRITSVVSFERK